MKTLAVLVALSVGLVSQAQAGHGGGGHGGGGRSSSHASGKTGTGSSSSSHETRGYTKKDGTQVAPHRQTNPDHTQQNNYSAKGNVNPSNGAVGTRYVTH